MFPKASTSDWPAQGVKSREPFPQWNVQAVISPGSRSLKLTRCSSPACQGSFATRRRYILKRGTAFSALDPGEQPLEVGAPTAQGPVPTKNAGPRTAGF